MTAQEGVLYLLYSLLKPILLYGGTTLLVLAAVLAAVYLVKNKQYKATTYYADTKIPLLMLINDKGRLGEYLTFKYLKGFEKQGAKFLFNVYVPKEDGETSEIDVLMLCSKGIFVFESKNYSGWIFGSEDNKNWCQTLPQGKGKSNKEYFYNPVMQNRSHIKHLKSLLGEIPMHSVIVFSERCTLKEINLHSTDIQVITRQNAVRTVEDICRCIPQALLSADEVEQIYKKLYPLTQVDEAIKAQHIENINNTTPPAPKQETGECSIKEKHEELKCPKCGAMLVLRTASKGENKGNSFYGCSNYPKCRYIQNIEK